MGGGEKETGRGVDRDIGSSGEGGGQLGAIGAVQVQGSSRAWILRWEEKVGLCSIGRIFCWLHRWYQD